MCGMRVLGDGTLYAFRRRITSCSTLPNDREPNADGCPDGFEIRGGNGSVERNLG